MTTYHKILSADKTELRRMAIQTADLNQKMYAMLERARETMLNTYDVNDHPASGDTDCDICARDIEKLLAEARGVE